MKRSSFIMLAAIATLTTCIACNNETKNDAKSGSMENADEARKDTFYDTSSLDSAAIPPFDSDMDTTGNAAKGK